MLIELHNRESTEKLCFIVPYNIRNFAAAIYTAQLDSFEFSNK